MALILNKSVTGSTSVDASGNTLTTGFTNLNYLDNYGNLHENPYLVIDNVILDKNKHFCKIGISIYKDQESREAGKSPVHFQYYVCEHNPDLYEQYFSMINMENKNIFESSYIFINDQYYTSWKSDEV